MSLPENVAENFSTSIQENQLQVDKHHLVNTLKTTGSLLDKKTI
jgi:hypothetical protein